MVKEWHPVSFMHLNYSFKNSLVSVPLSNRRISVALYTLSSTLWQGCRSNCKLLPRLVRDNAVISVLTDFVSVYSAFLDGFLLSYWQYFLEIKLLLVTSEVKVECRRQFTLSFSVFLWKLLFFILIFVLILLCKGQTVWVCNTTFVKIKKWISK